MTDSNQWSWGHGFCNLHKGQGVPCKVCIHNVDEHLVRDEVVEDYLYCRKEGKTLPYATPAELETIAARLATPEPSDIVPAIDMKVHWIQTASDPKAKPIFPEDHKQFKLYRELLEGHTYADRVLGKPLLDDDRLEALRMELATLKAINNYKPVDMPEVREKIKELWAIEDAKLASRRNPCAEITLGDHDNLLNPNLTDEDFSPVKDTKYPNLGKMSMGQQALTDVPTPARSLGKSVSPNFQTLSVEKSEKYSKLFSDSSLGKSFHQLDLYIKIVLHEHGMPATSGMVMACRKQMIDSLNTFLQSNQPAKDVSENNAIDG